MKLPASFFAAALAIAVSLAPAPGAATAPDIHPEILHALNAVPGGQATTATSAEWPELGITFTVDLPTTRAVGSCATGLICAYRNGSLGGARITFSGCSTWSTTGFGAVGSVANARTSGWANARNTAGTVLTHVPYGTWANVPAGVASIACGGNGITGVVD